MKTTTAVTFHKNNAKLIQVKFNGIHAGWLDHNRYRPVTGTHRPVSMWWEGVIAGQKVSASSLTEAKQKSIAACATKE